MAFAVCLSSHLLSPFFLAAADKAKRRNCIHSSVSVGRKKAKERWNGERDEGWNETICPREFISFNQAHSVRRLLLPRHMHRGCVKSTPKFKVERERDPATTKTTTLHLTDSMGPAAAGEGVPQ